MFQAKLCKALLPAVFLLALANASNAQNDGTPMLDEITVTAQKREQSLIEVPLSVSAFQGDYLDDIGAANLADFLQIAPGVSIVGANSGLDNVNIRGISSTFGDSPVGYYLDEVSFSLIANPQVVDVRTYDLERVEVLRGPQGTLYGDGSIGGVIRVLTHNPEFNKVEFKADVDYATTEDSDDDSAALKAAVNIPLVEDTLALRLVGSREDIGGWVDSVLTGEKDINSREVDTFRAKLRWAPTDALDIVFGAWDYGSENGGNSSLADRTTDQPQAEAEDAYTIYSLTADYDFGGASIISATSVMDWSLFQLGELAGLPLVTDQTQDLLQQELRFSSSSDGNFYWTAGAYYREIERDLAAQIFGLNLVQFADSQAWAVFTEGTWTLMDDAVDVTVGLRYFEDQRTRLDQPDLIGVVESKFDTITPRLNVAYNPSENWMIYGNVSKGFRSGQIQPIISIVTAGAFGIEVPIGIDAETLWSYEIGTKGSTADGRLSLEAAVYFNDWEDLQLNQILDPLNQLSALVNAGNGGVTGLEFNLVYQPSGALTFQLGGNFNQAEYDDDLTADGINVSSGQQIANVPDTTMNASVTYRPGLTNNLNGYAYLGAQYTSERTDVANFALASDDVTMVNARFGAESERWGAFLIIDNVTDEDGTFAPTFLNSFGNAARFQPRTIGLNLRYRY